MAERSSTPRVLAYTDGGCRGNPGIGGWGFLLIDRLTGRALERRGGERDTTNNRMEMTAAIQAIEALKAPRRGLEMRSDSRYLIDMCQSWIPSWKQRGWKRKGNREVKNLDLVQQLDALLQKHEVVWHWVPGHAGEPGNEYVDQLVNSAMDDLEWGRSPGAELRHVRCPVPVIGGRR